MHFCASGARSPALGPHTFSRLEPGIGVGGAGLQSLGRLVLFFVVDARHGLGTPWEISGDPELPGEMVPSTVRLGDGDGKKGGHGNGNGEMLVLECSFLDPKIPNRFHKIPRISGEESISGRILMEDPRKIHPAEL